MADDIADISPIELATELTIAWLGNPNSRVNAEDVPAFIQTMYATVTALAGSGSAEAEPVTSAEYEPAVTVRKSLGSKEHIISLIDGKPYKTLRRHLSTHGLTPDEYRARYGLKADYPMVAPAYSEARRQMAKSIGLGRKPGMRKNTVPAVTSDAPAPKASRGRPKKNA
ncbi:MAG: transcriptional regulator [Sphingomonas bacterium]|jgi:predicted transcriptional regulator|uniref:MucR family transcriptional regulator n=1 Tax=Sphingomonas bacterium TaxID=1895847 RepID=UPI002639C178|nr:MucR family transcriptional regulator [Sphingomonas bacterium]MDB5704929.1 transcriptional regulator [Sphingomonas bacterium]